MLLEKLTGFHLLTKFPAFYGTRRFSTAVTSARHLSLSWASSIQSIAPHPNSRREDHQILYIIMNVVFRIHKCTFVLVVLTLQAGRLRNCSSIPGRSEWYSSSSKRSHRLCIPPTLLPNAYRQIFPYGKAPEVLSRPLTPCIAKARNEWRCTSTPQHALKKNFTCTNTPLVICI